MDDPISIFELDPNATPLQQAIAASRFLHKADREFCTTGAAIVGGHLHVVLDDGNTECVAGCREAAERDKCAPCIALCDLLDKLNVEEREQVFNDLCDNTKEYW